MGIMTTKTFTLPKAFIWRRLHSLLGLWIVIFLIEHMVTNSQAALLVGQNGMGFIRAVNFLKHLPYLPVIEIVLLGVPILLHGVWGVRILMTSKMNASSGKGNRPALPDYKRNQAYVWQRVTSWILLFGLLFHIGSMRFYLYPVSVNTGERSYEFVRIGMDPGLYSVADRLGVKLYNQDEIERATHEIHFVSKSLEERREKIEKLQEEEGHRYHEETDKTIQAYQMLENKKLWLEGLTKRRISSNEVIAEAPNFGTAVLLVVRDSFRNIWIAALYTIFVLAAVFHAFNGLWTFMITWGMILKMRSQSSGVNWCVAIMCIIGFLGLASIWGTYFINLRT
jgi:succinate dehydrogenase / fumarate reductase cytochrome b subunit